MVLTEGSASNQSNGARFTMPTIFPSLEGASKLMLYASMKVDHASRTIVQTASVSVSHANNASICSNMAKCSRLPEVANESQRQILMSGTDLNITWARGPIKNAEAFKRQRPQQIRRSSGFNSDEVAYQCSGTIKSQVFKSREPRSFRSGWRPRAADTVTNPGKLACAFQTERVITLPASTGSVTTSLMAHESECNEMC